MGPWPTVHTHLPQTLCEFYGLEGIWLDFRKSSIFFFFFEREKRGLDPTQHIIYCCSMSSLCSDEFVVFAKSLLFFGDEIVPGHGFVCCFFFCVFFFFIFTPRIIIPPPPPPPPFVPDTVFLRQIFSFDYFATINAQNEWVTPQVDEMRFLPISLPQRSWGTPMVIWVGFFWRLQIRSCHFEPFTCTDLWTRCQGIFSAQCN